ncbi:MAG: type II toxin-antitoxin system VapC family toxin, partial [Gemmatimonadetes bacterium]|nr:type II toxin-antitoxin system VapC family toxin [Gemmatimonadota bacterium]
MPANSIFLDSSFFVALAIETDLHHPAAVELGRKLERSSMRYVTTHPILLEIGNALSRLRFRRALADLLDWVHDDPHVSIVPLTNELFERGVSLFRSRRDKEWGLTDCISFVVMNDNQIH